MGIRRAKGEELSGERWLEVDATMTGTLTFKDPVNLSINGRFEGTLDTQGKLAIGEQAQVRAIINGEQVVVAGSVEGDVTATKLIDVRATGRISGKVVTPRLIVQDGGILHGSVEMMHERSREGWMNVEELARFLEVDAGTVIQWAQEGRVPSQREGATWRFERARVEDWLAQERIK